MRIIDCEQRSPEWEAVKRGVPSASEFGNIIQPVKLGYAAAATTYIYRLIDQVKRPDVAASFTGNRHTERGCELEPEAREVYAFERDVSLRQVGFVLNDEGTLGCSPDSLVLAPRIPQSAIDMVRDLGEPDGIAALDFFLANPYTHGVEIKCPDGPTHLAWLHAGKIPPEHLAQVHGSMIVTGLQAWDFVSYCPPYPTLIVRAVPDNFTEALRGCLDRFVDEYRKAREELEAMS